MDNYHNRLLDTMIWHFYQILLVDNVKLFYIANSQKLNSLLF